MSSGLTKWINGSGTNRTTRRAIFWKIPVLSLLPSLAFLLFNWKLDMTTTESVKRGRVLAKLKSNVRHAAYFITSMETFKAEQSSDAPRGPTTLKDHCKSVLKKLKQPAPEDSTKTSTRTSAITSARTSVSSIEDPEPIVFASSRVSRVPTLNALSLADEAPLTMDTTDVKDKSGFGLPVREPIKTRATVVSPIQAQSGFRPSSVNRRFSSDPTQRFHQIAQQLKTHTSSLDLGKMGNDSGSLSSDGNSAKLGNGAAGDRRKSSLVL